MRTILTIILCFCCSLASANPLILLAANQCVAPVVPTSVSSGSLTSSGATITFSGGSGATSYTIDYGTTTGYGTNIAATSPQAITGLSASTLYHYRVNAVNSCGTTNGADNTFTTSASASNGEVGNKSGANDDFVQPQNYPGNDQSLTGCFVAGTTGTVGYIHAYMYSSTGSTGQQYNAGIYTSTGTLIVDSTTRDEPATIPGIISFTLDSPTTVTSGTTYCLSMGAHNSPDNWALSNTNIPGSNTYTDTTFTVGDTLPASSDVTTVRTPNYVPRIWATNTANGN